MGTRTQATYEDILWLLQGRDAADIAGHGFVLTPGRYVGAAEVEDDDEPFDEKMKRMVTMLSEQFAEVGEVGKAIKANLKETRIWRLSLNNTAYTREGSRRTLTLGMAVSSSERPRRL